MNRFFSLIWFLAFTCLGCLFQDELPADSLVGGGSDLPEISGQVVGKDKKERPFATVRLISGNYAPGIEGEKIGVTNTLVDEVVADEVGRFNFMNISPQQYYLEVITADSQEISISSPIEITENSSLVTPSLKLSDASRLMGFSNNLSIGYRSLHIAGTHYKTLTSNQIDFLLPKGQDYRMVAQWSQEGYPEFTPLFHFSLLQSETLNLDTVDTDPELLILYDFESLDSRNGLRGIAFSDNDNVRGIWRIDGAGINNFSTSPSDSTVYITKNNAFRNNSLVSFPDKKSSFYVASSYTDLSKMTAFEFYARGNGSIVISFRTKAVPEGEGTFKGSAIILSDDWNKFSIPANQIYPPVGSVTEQKGTTWQEASTGVVIININYTGTDPFMMDNIAIRGMSYLDF